MKIEFRDNFDLKLSFMRNIEVIISLQDLSTIVNKYSENKKSIHDFISTLEAYKLSSINKINKNSLQEEIVNVLDEISIDCFHYDNCPNFHYKELIESFEDFGIQTAINFLHSKFKRYLSNIQERKLILESLHQNHLLSFNEKTISLSIDGFYMEISEELIQKIISTLQEKLINTDFKNINDTISKYYSFSSMDTLIKTIAPTALKVSTAEEYIDFIKLLSSLNVIKMKDGSKYDNM